MIISGINLGANMGDDTIYSGTRRSGNRGLSARIPSLAISLASKAGSTTPRRPASRSSWSIASRRAATRARMLT